MRITSVVGARPQFVKLAPVDSALRRSGVAHRVVHTGQHYDLEMSGAFFDGLELPQPAANLGVGSGGHGAQTGRMLSELESSFNEDRPDAVLVYGDTNSTIAATLAAVKLGIPTAHLEAGLRSFNRAMPEEHNRVLTDHAADLLLAPTRSAMVNLDNEGLAQRSHLVGDVMVDICLSVARSIDAAGTPVTGDLPQEFVLATIHRPYNTDSPERLRTIARTLAEFPVPVVLSVHPRLASRAVQFDVDLERGSIRVVPPLSYADLVACVMKSGRVVTDSGGLQKEAYVLGAVCSTLRSETEWVETLKDGWNRLCFEDLSNLAALALRNRPSVRREAPFGDGNAADTAVQAVMAHLMT